MLCSQYEKSAPLAGFALPMFFANPHNSHNSHAGLDIKTFFRGGGCLYPQYSQFLSFRLFAALFATLFFLVSCDPPASSSGPRSQTAIFGSLQKATERLNQAVQYEADAAKKICKY